MIDLEGKTALVTGGGRGIGRATALRLAQAGADVYLTYLNSPADARDVAAEIMALGRKTCLFKADLSKPDDVENLARALAEATPRLDIFVSNAAGGGFRPGMDVSSDNFDYAMNLNAKAFLLFLKHGAELLRPTEAKPTRGRVITISSFGATRALPMYAGIGATKAALESLTRHFALELGPMGINVNCVRAGVVDTGALRALDAAQLVLEERAKRSLVEERNVSPEDVADAVLFLASPLANMIQGETLVVDGGTSLHP